MSYYNDYPPQGHGGHEQQQQQRLKRGAPIENIINGGGSNYYSMQQGGQGQQQGQQGRPYGGQQLPPLSSLNMMPGDESRGSPPLPPMGNPALGSSGGAGGKPGSAGGTAASTSNAAGGAAGAAPGPSEFVKKLYQMLEDGQYGNCVSWSPTGDSFVVKDMGVFTRTVLPMHFKHSNFASFVRQLNKYDFHKVKNPEESSNPYGDATWEFKHPNFRADMKGSLDTIKRKTVAPKKAGAGGASRKSGTPTPAYSGAPSPTSGVGPSSSNADLAASVSALHARLEHFSRAHHSLDMVVANLTRDYQGLVGELMGFQRNMVAQDQLTQSIIQYLVNLEAEQEALKGGHHPQHGGPLNGQQQQQQHGGQFVPSQQAQKLISSYTEVAKASYDHMADLSRRASLAGAPLPPIPPPPPSFGQFEMPGVGMVGLHGDGRTRELSAQDASPTNGGPSPSGMTAPQQQQQQQQPPQIIQGQQQQQSLPKLLSGWAVPPRVLLVEDDAVCRKLSSRFLQFFGCSIDVAVDGVSAVNKMNAEKYDLVLMDIVMPNLDGVSATSLIRQFDPTTPIISMTSNSTPNEVVTYLTHGMNDVLPKPFTKEGLLGMLEKHLIHLKVMAQMAEIPRALGFTDNQIQDALASSATDEGTVMNPFSAMGISDADYLDMLQSMAMDNKTDKRALAVIQGDEREGKRARFQEVDETGVNA